MAGPLRISVILDAMDRITRPLESTRRAAERAGSGMRELSARKQQLDRQLADVAAFRTQVTATQRSRDAWRTAQTEAQRLGREIANTTNPTREQTRAFERARAEERRLSTEHRNQQRELGELRRRLREAGISTRDLSEHERRLRGELGRTNREIDEQRRRLEALQRQQQRLGRAQATYQGAQNLSGQVAGAGAGAMAAGAAVITPLGVAVKDDMAFQSRLTDIGQKGNLTREQRVDIGVKVRAVSIDTNQFQEDILRGVDTLAGFGMAVPKAVEIAAPMGKAATAYKADVADLSAATFAATDNLGIPIDRAARGLDIMAAAGKAGAFEIKDMAQYLPAATASYKALEQQGEGALADLAAAYQIVRKGAGDNASAATNLSGLLNKINSPITAEKFAKRGVNLGREMKAAEKRGESPLEAIAKATQKATGGDLKLISHLFEDTEAQNALRPLIMNLEEFRRIKQQAMSAEGTVDADFADRMRDNAEQAKRTAIEMKDLALTAGEAVQPVVTEVLENVSAMADRLGKWAKANPEVVNTVMRVTAVVGGLLLVLGAVAMAVAAVLGPFALMNLAFVSALPVFTGIGGALMGVARSLGLVQAASAVGRITGLTRAFAAARAAAIGFNLAMLANPIVLIVAAIIAAVVIVALLIRKYWGPISAFVKGMFAGLKEALGPTIEQVRATLERLRPVLEPIGRMAMVVFGPFIAVLKWLWNAFQNLLTPVKATDAQLQKAGDAGRQFGNLLGAAIKFVLNPIGGLIDLLKKVWSTIAQSDIGKAFRDAFSSAFKWFDTLPERFKGIGKALMDGLKVGIQLASGNVVGAAVTVSKQLTAGAKGQLKVKSPSRVFMAIGSDVSAGLALGIEQNEAAPVRAARQGARRAALEAAEAGNVVPFARPAAAQRAAARAAGVAEVLPLAARAASTRTVERPSSPQVTTAVRIAALTAALAAPLPLAAAPAMRVQAPPAAAAKAYAPPPMARVAATPAEIRAGRLVQLERELLQGGELRPIRRPADAPPPVAVQRAPAAADPISADRVGTDALAVERVAPYRPLVLTPPPAALSLSATIERARAAQQSSAAAQALATSRTVSRPAVAMQAPPSAAAVAQAAASSRAVTAALGGAAGPSGAPAPTITLPGVSAALQPAPGVAGAAEAVASSRAVSAALGGAAGLSGAPAPTIILPRVPAALQPAPGVAGAAQAIASSRAVSAALGGAAGLSGAPAPTLTLPRVPAALQPGSGVAGAATVVTSSRAASSALGRAVGLSEAATPTAALPRLPAALAPAPSAAGASQAVAVSRAASAALGGEAGLTGALAPTVTAARVPALFSPRAPVLLTNRSPVDGSAYSPAAALQRVQSTSGAARAVTTSRAVSGALGGEAGLSAAAARAAAILPAHAALQPGSARGGVAHALASSHAASTAAAGAAGSAGVAAVPIGGLPSSRPAQPFAVSPRLQLAFSRSSVADAARQPRPQQAEPTSQLRELRTLITALAPAAPAFAAASASARLIAPALAAAVAGAPGGDALARAEATRPALQAGAAARAQLRPILFDGDAGAPGAPAIAGELQPIRFERPRSALQPAASSPGAPASAGATAGAISIHTGPISIHIHPQPGDSPHDIARVVQEVLEKTGREAAARARSSYGDRD